MRTLATFDLHNILPDGCYLLLTFPETSDIFAPEKWMVGSWNTGTMYIYIYVYSLGHFGLFSGVNSLAVSGRNRR